MAYNQGASDRDYYGGGGGNSGRSTDRGRDAGGFGGARSSGKAGRKLAPEPNLMRTHFMSDKKYPIHRDVLKIRIRQYLGNSAYSYVGRNEEDGAYGNFYRAETPLTKAQIQDLVRDTIEYVGDPKGFQNRLDRHTWDHSQFTDPGEPGNSDGTSRNRADSGFAPDNRPQDMGSSMQYGQYAPNPNDSRAEAWNQSRGQDPSYDRGAGRGSSMYGDYNQGYDSDPRTSGTGYGPGQNYQAGGPTQRSSTDSYGYGPSLAPIGESTMSPNPRDTHTRRFGNDQPSYSGTQGYGSTGMPVDDPFSTTSPVGTGFGGYADQFLNTMPPPTSYDPQYGSSVGSSTTSDRCVSCGKKAGKCNCAYVSTS